MINKHINELESLKRRILLKSQLDDNLLFFKQEHPNIHKHYINYKSKRFNLSEHREGYTSIVDSENKFHEIYPCDPEQYCRDTVDNFLKYPSVKCVGLPKPRRKTEFRIHAKTINSFQEMISRNSSRLDTYTPIDNNIEMLIINGVGIGKHIEYLLQKTTITNIIIIEPDEDLFYTSLFFTDWKSIFEHFNKTPSSIHLSIGAKPDELIEQLTNKFFSTGIFNVARCYFFNHLESKEHNATTGQIIEAFTKSTLSLGFFDDEQVSLAHTHQNLNENTYILHKNNLSDGKDSLPPIFIVGNGPSLDKSIRYLKKHKDYAFIMSCGTSIGTLRNHGIKPDFHTELERLQEVEEVVIECTSKDYRDGIFFLTTNTIHPKVPSLFKEKAFALKYNDLGANITNSLLGKTNYLTNCNPMVSNLGVALAEKMGFKDIYLIGIDCAFGSDGEHHATDKSIYSRLKSDYLKSINNLDSRSKDNFTTKGNFRERVLTNSSFYSSAESIELLIEQSNVNIKNCSDGTYIKGSKSLPPEKLDFTEKIDKGATMKLIKKNSFYRYDTNESIIQSFSEEAKPIINSFLENTNNQLKHVGNDRQNILKFLDLHHKELMFIREKSQDAFQILKGSCMLISLCISHICQFNQTKMSEESIALYTDFINKALHIVNNNINRLDQTTDGFKKHIKNQ